MPMDFVGRSGTPIPEAIRLSGDANEYTSPTIEAEGYGGPETYVNYRRGPVRPPSTAYSDAQYKAEYPSWLPFDPNKTLDESYTFPFPAVQGDPWENTFKTVKELDDTMCDDWVEEIQSLLIFAGLFSAVVTAFAVETQKLLQPDTGIGAIILLAQLASRQSESNSSSFPDPSTITAPYLNSINSPVQSLRINSFIFVSLILSLGTALVGTLSLQWIRSYRKREANPYPDQLAIRYNRYIGLVGWKVPEIITSLSLIIQASLVIFFVGIIDFLFSLNSTLAIIAIAIISVILAFVLFTTVAPAFHSLFITKLPDNPGRKLEPLVPFQSPQAWIFFRGMLYLRQVYQWLVQRKKWEWSLTKGRSWSYLISDYDGPSCALLRGPSLAWVFQNCKSDNAFYNAYHCFRDLPPLNMAKTVIDILDPSRQFEFYSKGRNLVAPSQGNREPWIERETLCYNLLSWDLHGRNHAYDTPRRQVRQHLHELEARLHVDIVANRNLFEQSFTPWPNRPRPTEPIDPNAEERDEEGNRIPPDERRFVSQQKLTLFSVLTRLHSHDYDENSPTLPHMFRDLWMAIFQESAAEQRVQKDSIRVLKAWMVSIPVRPIGDSVPRPAIWFLLTHLLCTCIGQSPNTHPNTPNNQKPDLGNQTLDGHPVTQRSIERIFSNQHFHDFLDTIIESPELLRAWRGVLIVQGARNQQLWDTLLRTHIHDQELEPHHILLAHDPKAAYAPVQNVMSMVQQPLVLPPTLQQHYQWSTSRPVSFVQDVVYYGPHLSESPAPMSAALPSSNHPDQPVDGSIAGAPIGSAMDSNYGGVLSSSAVEDSNRSTNVLFESPIPRRPENWVQDDFSRFIARPPTPFKRVTEVTEDDDEDEEEEEEENDTRTEDGYELGNVIPNDAPPLSARFTMFYSAPSADSLPMDAFQTPRIGFTDDDAFQSPRIGFMDDAFQSSRIGHGYMDDFQSPRIAHAGSTEGMREGRTGSKEGMREGHEGSTEGMREVHAESKEGMREGHMGVGRGAGYGDDHALDHHDHDDEPHTIPRVMQRDASPRPNAHQLNDPNVHQLNGMQRESSWDDSHFAAYRQSRLNALNAQSSRSTTLSVNNHSSMVDLESQVTGTRSDVREGGGKLG